MWTVIVKMKSLMKIYIQFRNKLNYLNSIVFDFITFSIVTQYFYFDSTKELLTCPKVTVPFINLIIFQAWLSVHSSAFASFVHYYMGISLV